MRLLQQRYPINLKKSKPRPHLSLIEALTFVKAGKLEVTGLNARWPKDISIRNPAV